MPGSMHFARRFWREERQGSPEDVGRQQLSSLSPFAGITQTGSTGVVSARTAGTPARPNVFQVDSLRSRTKALPSTMSLVGHFRRIHQGIDGRLMSASARKRRTGAEPEALR